MGRISTRGIILLFALSNLVSCTSTPPSVLNEQQRAKFGVVGVVSVDVSPDEVFDAPMIGRGRGAASGAGAGAAQGAGAAVQGLAGSTCHGMGCGLTILLIPVFAVGGAIVGGVAGAVNAVPEDVAIAIEQEIASALMGSRPQETLRQEVMEAARAQGVSAETPLTESGSVAINTIDYGFLSKKGINTVLEVSIVKVGLIGDRGSDPDLILVVEASFRLVSAKTSQGIFARDRLLHIGSRYKLAGWGANKAERLKLELQKGYEELADKIVEQVFLVVY